MAPIKNAGGIAWHREIVARSKTEFCFKLFGISAFMAVFFVGYFALLKNPIFPAKVMPLTGLDHWIGFHPHSLLLYLSLWFYVSLFPGMLATKRQLLAYGAGTLGLSLAGFLVFLLFPTAVPAPDIDLIAHPQFASLKAIDATGNACPSLHVAFAVFTAIWAEVFFKRIRAPGWIRWLSAVWCAGIIYSTLATKQHVALDALGGLVLGALVAVLHLKLARRHILP